MRGTQVLSNPFGTQLRSDGDLVGVVYITSRALDGQTPSGATRLSGTELFVGCYDADASGTCENGEPNGTISFSFRFTLRFDPATGAPTHGRALLVVTGGTGDFFGVSGSLNSHGIIERPGTASYVGPLRWG